MSAAADEAQAAVEAEQWIVEQTGAFIEVVMGDEPWESPPTQAGMRLLQGFVLLSQDFAQWAVDQTILLDMRKPEFEAEMEFYDSVRADEHARLKGEVERLDEAARLNRRDVAAAAQWDRTVRLTALIAEHAAAREQRVLPTLEAYVSQYLEQQRSPELLRVFHAYQKAQPAVKERYNDTVVLRSKGFLHWMLCEFPRGLREQLGKWRQSANERLKHEAQPGGSAGGGNDDIDDRMDSVELEDLRDDQFELELGLVTEYLLLHKFEPPPEDPRE
jgi:hypothetical protein